MCEPFRAVNAIEHASPAEVARHAGVVFCMVADAPDVRELCFGAAGLVAGANPGLIVVDMSTISPNDAREIGGQLARHGIAFLDAPVSGGEVGAIQASLTIMVGGLVEVFTSIRPLLEIMGSAVTYIGVSGAGQVAKACNQILTGCGVAALAEAFNFAIQRDGDLVSLRASLLKNGRASSNIIHNHGQRLIDRNFQPGFKAWMHQKDMRIVMAEAHRLGLALAASAIATQEINALVGAGLGEQDSITVLRLLEHISTKQHQPETSNSASMGVNISASTSANTGANQAPGNVANSEDMQRSLEKHCAVILIAVNLAACAEAARLANASGINFDLVRKAMLSGAAGSKVLELFGAKMARRDYKAEYQTSQLRYELNLTLSEAATHNIPVPVSSVVLQQLNAMLVLGWGEQDAAGLFKLLEYGAEVRV